VAGGAAEAAVDVEGGVWTRAARGPWDRVGELGDPPAAFTAVDARRFVAATGSAVLESSDGGRTWAVLAYLDART
jgi:photosystem II stability/assembly factor-like uncharacterized protein